jgi:hypothetical protein
MPVRGQILPTPDVSGTVAHRGPRRPRTTSAFARVERSVVDIGADQL